MKFQFIASPKNKRDSLGRVLRLICQIWGLYMILNLLFSGKNGRARHNQVQGKHHCAAQHFRSTADQFEENK